MANEQPTDENTPQIPETWNQKFTKWVNDSGSSVREIAITTSISRGSIHDYTTGRVTEMDRVSRRNRKILYDLTGIPEFKYDGIDKPEEEKPIIELKPNYERQDNYERLSETIKGLKEGIDRLVAERLECLPGNQRFLEGLLQSQIQKPTVKQRAGAIMEIIDVLAEEVDYFRTASDDERKELVASLKREPESYGYVTQLLNVIYSGKQLDNWMLLAQPPARIKKRLNKDE